MIKRWFFNGVYCAVLVFFAPILLFRMLKQGKYRCGFRQKFWGYAPSKREILAKFSHKKDVSGLKTPKKIPKILWFHAVSVGEVNLLAPLIQKIEETKPDWCCVLSTTSTTGMNLAQKLYGQRFSVFYCPLDFSWAVTRALRLIEPDMLILTEQEFWPNLIDAAKKRHVKLAVINARLSEVGYRRYRWVRFLMASMLRKIDMLAVQSETYAGWFHQLEMPQNRILITGSMKFDGITFHRDNTHTSSLRKLAGISDTDVVFLAGSTQYPEERMALETYENLKADFPQLRLILVPRHPERFNEVAQLLESRGVLWEKRSELLETKIPEHENSSAEIDDATNPQTSDSSQKRVTPRILLVDSVGELAAWWGTATVGFVGGSMGSRGGQNMIEPAAYGVAICFGPNTKNFRDIVELMLRQHAAQVVHDQREMEIFVQHCLTHSEERERLSQQAQNLVREQQGATERTLTMLEKMWDNESHVL